MIPYTFYAPARAILLLLLLLEIGTACDSTGPVGEQEHSTRDLSSAASQIAVSPSQLDFRTTTSRLFLSVLNETGSLVYWNAGTSRSCIKCPESNGRIESGASETIAVDAIRSGLTPGSYEGAVQIRSTAGSFTIPVDLTVQSGIVAAELFISPNSLDFGTAREEMTFTIQNPGGAALNWSGGTSSGWVRLPVPSGQVAPGASQTIIVRVERSQVESGTHQAQIQVQSTGGSGSLSIKMEKQVSTSPSGSIVNVRQFGARGDGQADDARAFRAAIEALPSNGGTVYVPAGIYRLSPIHIGPYRPIDLTRMANVTILGEGMSATILQMAGGWYEGAAFMFLIFKSSNISIKNLTIDMNRAEARYGDEQSHQIRAVSSTDIVIDRVRFRSGPGDGVYLLGEGEPGEPWTQRVRILNSVFTDLWRNGITIQRGVENVEIRGNTFEILGDQAVSSEPSGSGASPRDLVVVENRVHHSNANWAVAMSGARQDQPLQDLTFRNNIIENGSAYFQRIERLEVSGNRVMGDRWHPPLRMENVRNAEATANTIIGVRPDQTDGTLQVVNEQEALSFDVVLSGNTVTAGTNSTGIYVRDAKGGITIVGNTLIGANSKKGVMIENLISMGTLRTDFSIANNQIRNFQYSIVLSSRGDRYSSVDILRNVMSHNQLPSTLTVGILCSLVADCRTFSQIMDNTFGFGILRSIMIE